MKEEGKKIYSQLLIELAIPHLCQHKSDSGINMGIDNVWKRNLMLALHTAIHGPINRITKEGYR